MKRITVLLADDNRVVRKGFKKILELEGDIKVIGEAKNGHQAVIMAKKLRPRLVLMDLAMPLLNGLTKSIWEPQTRLGAVLSAVGVAWLVKQAFEGFETA